MNDHPMMKCGHAANAVHKRKDGTEAPSCVICAGIKEGWDVIDDAPPDLSKRKARCAYYGTDTRQNRNPEGPCRGGVCKCERPSTDNLAFFEHKPTKEFDEFYCGCFGWD